MLRNTPPSLIRERGGKFDLSIMLHYLDNNYHRIQIVAYLGQYSATPIPPNCFPPYNALSSIE